jgi:hypothetical protein
LAALAAIASRPPADSEPLDPLGMRRGIAALEALSRDAALPRERRARAISVLRALSRAGYLDAGRIDTSLDPR